MKSTHQYGAASLRRLRRAHAKAEMPGDGLAAFGHRAGSVLPMAEYLDADDSSAGRLSFQKTVNLQSSLPRHPVPPDRATSHRSPFVIAQRTATNAKPKAAKLQF